ncbi:MAG TPA: FAD-binding oxidoreductase [Terriglobia bacterium]|nr:FAD-binding oxidoreductase [Terriglobia bacterium]
MWDMVSTAGMDAARQLRDQMQGAVLSPADSGYGAALQIWNGAIEHRPALFARCETPRDVQLAVQAARRYGVALSVRGGGHDWAGRALRPDGLVIDLSPMRSIEIDAKAKVARVEGGVLAADLIEAAAPHGLVAVTGAVGTVGLAGLTLGGGYGPLCAKYGLALDHLVAAEVVLADGRMVEADATRNTDLFWALRGGGGNFGVVTAMYLRLHALREVVAGLILFPWFEAETVLRGYAEAAGWAPDELSVISGVVSDTSGNPLLFLAPCWSGEARRGEQIMAGLCRLGTPLAADIGPRSYASLLGMFDGQVVPGRHYTVQSRWLPGLTPPVISSIVAAGSTRTSPYTTIILQHFHGAAARVPLGNTAFGLRQEHFLCDVIAGWEPAGGDNGSAHRGWARTISQSLAAAALPGGYPSQLGPDHHEQIARAYGSNLVRLLDIKRRLDPDGVFCATPLPRQTAENMPLPAWAPARTTRSPRSAVPEHGR